MEEERGKKEDNSERREKEIGERRKVKVTLAKEINSLWKKRFFIF
jgi:hypothetical protein